MEKVAATIDLKECANVLADAERLLLKETGVIPLLYYSSRALVSDKIAGWNDNLMDVHKTRWLSLKQ